MTEVQEESLPPKREISSWEFNAIVNGAYREDSDYKSFYHENDTNSFLFENCIITDDLYPNFKLKDVGIILKNSQFKNFHLVECSIRKVVLGNNSNIVDIYINKAKVNAIHVIDGSMTQSIFVSKESTINSIDIHRSHVILIEINDSRLLNIRLRSSRLDTFESNDCDIRRISITQNCLVDTINILGRKVFAIIISNSRIDSYVLNGTNLESVKLTRALIRSMIVYKSGVKNFSTSNSEIGDFLIHNEAKIDYLFFNEKSVIGQLKILDSLLKEFSCTYFTYIHFLSLKNLHKESRTFLIEGCVINKTSFQIHWPYDLTIKELEVNKEKITSEIHFLDFKNTTFPKGAYMHISQTFISDISFDSFINEGTIVLNGIKPLNTYQRIDSVKNELLKNENGYFRFKEATNKERMSTIKINNSDLGNTQFIGCDLASFKHFDFNNSKILGIFIAGSTLPARDNIIRDKDKFEQRRLALSQFKKIYENQGDTVMASNYHSQEMEVYKMQVNFFEKPGTWLILWLSSITSDFGQNIWKPLASLLSIHYWLYMWALGVGAFEFNQPKEIVYYYFYLANPIHQYIFCNDWTIIIDISMRIWSSYMIYNFIRASRRFIK